MSDQARRIFEFGPYRMDPAERLLLLNGEPVPLTPKVFDALLWLLEKSGHIIQKEELISKIWPNTFVEEGNLKVIISKLRKTLEGASGSDKYIETVPKCGYRFIADVRESWVNNERPTSVPQTKLAQNVKSMAVLPFRLLGDDLANEYLGVGLADTLITRLSNVGQVLVRPTSSILKYGSAECDPVGVGRKLKVDAVLEGSIRRSGQRIRLVVQLVSVQNGAPLWAGVFDEMFTDIFTVEDSISRQVAEALTLQMTGRQKELLTKRYTENTEAFYNYLRGRYHWTKRTSGGLKKAIEYFRQAIEIDPAYALAYSGLADCYAQLSWLRKSAPRNCFPKAKAAAMRALEIDGSLAEAHTSLAWIKMLYDWDWLDAEREFKRSIELNPNYATSHLWYTVYLIAFGRFDEAINEIEKAQVIDPLSPIINTIRGWPFYFSRRYDEAIAIYRNALELDAKFFAAHLLLGHAYERKGEYSDAVEEFQTARQLDETAWTIAELGHAYAMSGREEAAKQIIQQLEDLSKSHYVSPYDVAGIYASLGEKEMALDWLEKSYEDRSSWLIFLKAEPRLDSLKQDTRFKNLLLRLGMS